MKAIIVDDEVIMLKSFMRLSAGIEGLNVVEQFSYPEDALEYVEKHRIELAILDVRMPGMSGIELAKELRKLRQDILIVFISAYDEYVRDSNLIGGDYYIVKPYKRETIEMMVQKMLLLSSRLHKELYIQMFGRFNVLRNGVPIPLNGKAKEILALVTSRRGKEVSNEEIYSTLWEGREYSNYHMKVYYNALKRLKDVLAEEQLSHLLISTPREQMINTEMFDCDYYAWQDDDMEGRDRFEGEFLSEYSWGEYLLAEIMQGYMKE